MAPAVLEVRDLRCEYLCDPLGIDVEAPRLSYRLAVRRGAPRGQVQKAYHIQVATSAERLASGNADLWDSGRIASGATSQIAYAGAPLRANLHCSWRVRVEDGTGRWSTWSRTAHWTVGPLRRSDWAAQWIGPPDAGKQSADPWLRKTVSLASKVRRATAWVASVGYHEFFVNGERVSERVLTPGVSDLGKHARYVGYDVTRLLDEGPNVLAFWLSSGWAAFAPYARAKHPLVLCQVEIETGVGKVRVVSDGSWRTHASSSSHIGGWGFGDYGGERQDAGLRNPDWNAIGFDDSKWPVAATYRPKLRVTAEMVEPNLRMQELNAVDFEKRGAAWRIDMGKSFTGQWEVDLEGEPGSTAELLVSERSDQDVTYRQRSELVFGASGRATFRHRFNYACGRWLTVRGVLKRPRSARGWLVHSGYASQTRFRCSNELLNRIHDAVVWTFRCLSVGGYVVDCSHRERWGYGGDAHATMETALTHFGTGAFFSKWLDDWRDVQDAAGNIAYTAPTYKGGGGPAWSGAIIALPWRFYVHYGDKRLLAQCYPAMRRWLEFLETKQTGDILGRYGHPNWGWLGDWVAPGKGQSKAERVDERSTEFFNNCYWLWIIERFARISEVLGKPGVAKAWRRRAERTRRAVHARFYDPRRGVWANGEQPYLALPLLVGLPDATLRRRIEQRLCDDITETKHGHLDTGIHGTYFLLEQLTRSERHDLVFKIATQRDYPSWGYMLDRGATTIWEQWDGVHSRCHSSFLSIGAWFIRGIAGLRPDASRPGYERVVIRPAIVGDLTWASAERDTPRGTFKSSWRLEPGRLVLDVTVPPGCEASVEIPAASVAAVTESDRALGEASGVRVVGRRAGRVVCRIGSGRYGFVASR